MNLMSEKKSNKPKDRHSNVRPGRTVRMHQALWDQLEKLAELNKSDATEEIRIAVRKHLAENHLWPQEP